jgi:hypothetical protein
MKTFLRSLLAVLLGIILGSVVNMALILASPQVIPPPAGVDVNNVESMRASIHLFEPKHFLFPFLAHALGTLVGATVVTAQPDALVASGGRRYPYAEMATLEIRALSVGRSAGVVAGVIAGTWALFTLLLLAAGWEADG